MKRTTALLLVVICGQFAFGADEPAGELARRLSGVTFDQYASAPGYSEGPVWREGEVFFCSGALLRVDAEGNLSTYLEIGPAGVAPAGNGHLLICDNKHKALLDLAPDGKLGVVAEHFQNRSLRSLNDVTLDARGNAYWTDPEGSSPDNPVGQVFRVRPDGRVDLMATGLAFPNGLDVDPAGKYLYVVESQSQKVLRYILPPEDEVLGAAEIFYDLGGSGGDGCAFDAEGNLWVADFHRPESGHGRITVLNPDAQVLAHLPLPAKVVSNIAFGGPQHDEIYCTTGDPPGVFHAAVGVAGFAGHTGVPLPIARYLNVVPMRPHADAERLRAIAAAAASATLADGDFDPASSEQIQASVAALADDRVRSDMAALVPELAPAAVRHARDKALLAEIARLNGKATLEVAAPDWLRSLAGDEALALFARIVEIDLNERTDGHKAPEDRPLADRVHDGWLAQLEEQTALRRLELSGTAVTSAGLAHLRGMTSLERLNVCLTAVDDEGLAHLSDMTNMKRLTVCSSQVTGSGFAHLQALSQLQSINLHSSPASDAGLEAIGRLHSLRRLEIVHTNVTDAGLAHLAGLVNLQQLHIASPGTTEKGLPFLGRLSELYELDVYERSASNSALAEVGKLPKLRMLRLFGGPFDDAGVQHLANLATLEELTLNSGQVTDAGLQHLTGLKKLRKLHLEGTRVTPAGIEQLKSQLPKLEVTP